MGANEHQVVIAGGGPVGMMLAAELALAGVDVAVFERRAEPELESARSGGLQARTLEELDQRGIVERFLAAGEPAQVNAFATIPIDISDFPSRHNHGLALWQNRFEQILGEWVAELPVQIRRGVAASGFACDATGVEVALSGGESVRAQYLVGCDGGRSTIRKAAGIEFAGFDASVSYLIAEARCSEPPEFGLRRDAGGLHAIAPLDGGERVRLVVHQQSAGATSGEPTLRDVSETLIALRGTDYGLHSPSWISRFDDTTRQAVSYRAGRVLLAGDAAHVHAPNGGQGLATGLQDAVNLGWKLAQVVKGISPESLLDSYHAERHPIGARVQRLTMAMTALSRGDDRTDALRETFAEMLGQDGPRRLLGAVLSGLGLRYDLGEGHPLLGRRMPDLELTGAGGLLRVFTLLHEARPLLLNLGEPGGVGVGGWAGRVQLIDGKYEGAWELPGIGAVPAPSAALVRPDGYVAWVGEGSADGLAEALGTWFGPPS